MASQFSELYAYLNDVLHYTNKEKPFDERILFIPYNYPLQNKEIIRAELPYLLSYRDHNKVPVSQFRERVNSQRPEDDTSELPKVNICPEYYENKSSDTYSAKFKIVRADKTEPHRVIAISEDYSVILGLKYHMNGNTIVFDPDTSVYPLQYKEFIGTSISVEVNRDINDKRVNRFNQGDGYILRADSTDPGMAIVMITIKINGIRKAFFYFEDEVVIGLNHERGHGNITKETKSKYIYDDDYTDYKTATEPDYNNDTDINNWFIYKRTGREVEYTDDEIAEIRKEILSGIIIYDE
jgi:hypothetical protein